MKSSKIGGDRTPIGVSNRYNFFLLGIYPTMYIWGKSLGVELFEKQHRGTPKRNKSNKSNS